MDIAKQYMEPHRIAYDNDSYRALMAAVCLKACVDYRKAIAGKMVDGKMPDVVIKECRRFFDDDMFQFFVNRIPVSEIERYISATPEGAIHSIWRRNELN